MLLHCDIQKSFIGFLTARWFMGYTTKWKYFCLAGSIWIKSPNYFAFKEIVDFLSILWMCQLISKILLLKAIKLENYDVGKFTLHESNAAIWRSMRFMIDFIVIILFFYMTPLKYYHHLLCKNFLKKSLINKSGSSNLDKSDTIFSNKNSFDFVFAMLIL